MCEALNFANEINSQVKGAREYYEKLKVRHSVIDGVQQDILHKIEDLDKFSLYTGWKFCKALNKLRKARRKTKNEIETMQLLISQLGNFQIKEEKIDGKASVLSKLNYENNYHKRQLEMTGDILEEVNSILDDIDNKNIVIKLIKEKDREAEEDKVYTYNEKLPKIKGKDVMVKFNNFKQRQHIINIYKSMYETYKVDNYNNIITLINRIH